MQQRDREREDLERELARARQVLRVYSDNGEGYLIRDGRLVTDLAEIAYVKSLIQQVDRIWTLLDATSLCETGLKRASRFLH